MRKIFAVLAVLMTVALLFAGCGIPKEAQNELTQLRNEKQQWAERESELEQLRAEKKKWEEVEKPAPEKQVAENETMGKLEGQITGLRGELSSKDEKIDKLETQISDLEAQRAKLEAQIKTQVPSQPTYGEVMNFLSEDKTEREKSQRHETYTYLFLKSARAQGLQGYPVIVFIPGRILVFAGFKTIEQGWVYILPAIDQQVKLEEGKSYRQLNGSSPFGEGDDTISEIVIFD